MIVEVNELTEQITDFAWRLSKDSSSATYPRVESREDLQTSLEKALEVENQSLIAYYAQGELQGLCVYLWDDEVDYAQAIQFLIQKNHYKQVAHEFLAFFRRQLSGYEFFVGVPVANENAADYFQESGFVCTESSIDTRLYNLQLPQVGNNDLIEKVTADSFAEYAVFHDSYALPEEMYYHSKNLKRYLEHFRILVLRRAGRICGSIFARISRGNAADIGCMATNYSSTKLLPRRGRLRSFVSKKIIRFT